jgi:hypothetical protein
LNTEYSGVAVFTFSITKRPVQILADNKYAYVGYAQPAYTYRISGAVAGETNIIIGTPSLSAPTANMSAAGNYAIVVDLTLVSTTANYVFAATPAVNGLLSVSVYVDPDITTPTTIPVYSISLDITSREVEVGETLQLRAYITPQNADNQYVKWSSSNRDVATVNAYGEVKGIANGFAYITATTDDGGYTASCELRVVSKNGTGIESTQGDVQAWFSGSTLFVSSPEDENVFVYSFNGQLLFMAAKQKGQSLFILGDRISEKFVIVSGSSGWVKRIRR